MSIIRAEQTSSKTDRDLCQALYAAYGLSIQGVDPLKSVLRIVDDRGQVWFWKRAKPGDEPRIAALAQHLQAVSRVGLISARPVPSRYGRYVERLSEEHLGYLQPAVAGHHATFTDRHDRVTTIAAVGYLHYLQPPAGQGVSALMVPPGLPLLRKLRTKAQAYRGALETMQHHGSCPTIPASIEVGLNAWECLSWESTATRVRRFCHRDMAPHNLLLQEGTLGLTFIDFDLAGYDHPFVDLLQVANHSLALHGPGLRNLFVDVVEVYRAVAGLSGAEEDLLWHLFAFPDVLVRSVLDAARSPDEEAGVDRVVRAIEIERWRIERLTEECPFGLY